LACLSGSLLTAGGGIFMKQTILIALVLWTAATVAQEQPAPAPPAPPQERFSTNLTVHEDAPSYSDLYCAGFVTKESVSRTNTIEGGINTPAETLFARGNTVFVTGGGLKEGEQYSVLREMKDPNHYEPFTGQKAALAEVGEPYAELGRVRVVGLRGKVAVAEVEFSCQNMTLGDIVVPFREHVPVEFKKSGTFERFPSNEGHLKARIVMGREFDAVVGTGRKVYLDAGSNKGVKVGMYFRAVRGYDPAKLNSIDNLSYNAPVGEDTQKTPGSVTPVQAKDLPERALGEMIVLNVTQTSATAMITNSLEAIQVGDWVEMEDER
jgi:hypothetical protein